MDDLELLKFYMKPYYQEGKDEGTLEHFLEQYGSPVCAAAYLWGAKMGEIGADSGKLIETREGSETEKYEGSGALYENARKQAEYYQKLCQKERGFSPSVLIKVKRTASGGAVYPPDVADEYSGN